MCKGQANQKRCKWRISVECMGEGGAKMGEGGAKIFGYCRDGNVLCVRCY